MNLYLRGRDGNNKVSTRRKRYKIKKVKNIKDCKRLLAKVVIMAKKLKEVERIRELITITGRPELRKKPE